jgi:hypothetical protein
MIKIGKNSRLKTPYTAINGRTMTGKTVTRRTTPITPNISFKIAKLILTAAPRKTIAKKNPITLGMTLSSSFLNSMLLS